MKKLIYLALFAGIVSAGCRKIEVDGGSSSDNGKGNGTTENTILEGRITENRTLKADYVYKLRGLVYVTNGAILTIEPGTKIVGEKGKNGGLIITRSCKIIADGTPEKPIVFTSEEANPQRGDWAGVVLLGNAPTNASFNGQQGIGEIEGGINNSDGLGLYGLGASSNPADNSGILRYVRIEYAGYAFLPDKNFGADRFGDIIICTCFQSCYMRGFIGQSRKKKNVGIIERRIHSYEPANLQPTLARHHNVQDDQVRLYFFSHLKRFIAACGYMYFITI